MRKFFSILLSSGVQLALGIALIVWGITCGYQNYQGDQCSQTFDALLASNQARIRNVQIRIDAVRAREAALQVRASEVAKKFNGRANDGK
jgi:hypothetical protein